MIIYCISNLLNGKCYIGQTKGSLDLRWRNHCRQSSVPQFPLHHAIHKYGRENFSRRVIYTCKTREEVDIAERYFIRAFRATEEPYGYNRTLGGVFGTGVHTQETKDKIRARNRGQVPWIKGRHHSPEACAAISNAVRGRKRTPEHQEKLAALQRGKKRSPEVCANIRASIKNRKGILPTPEHRAKISMALKGRPASNKGMPMSLEQKVKISMRQTARWKRQRNDLSSIHY